MTITIGHDAEVFVQENGEIISAIGLVGGTKEHPDMVAGGALQEDNVLAELNIEPAVSHLQFIGNTDKVMNQLLDRINPRGVCIKASHHFDKDYLMSLDRKALQFGCDPDFNAYTEEVNTPPNALTTLRTAGGHVHIGYSSDVNPYSLVKYMDLFLGIPSVILDQDTERRELYGKAGACRIKPYGVEYRTLSNFWLNTRELMEWVFNSSQQAYVAARDHEDFGVADETVVQAINTGDRDTARKIVDHLDLYIPNVF